MAYGPILLGLNAPINDLSAAATPRRSTRWPSSPWRSRNPAAAAPDREKRIPRGRRTARISRISQDVAAARGAAGRMVGAFQTFRAQIDAEREL